jgi:hypothetical protein
VKLEKAYKIVEKHEEKLAKEQKKKEKEIKSYHKYKKAGCFDCGYKGYIEYYGGEHSGGYYEKSRCECSLVKTKNYKNALKSDIITKKEFDKFFDNNKKCNGGNNASDRSW